MTFMTSTRDWVSAFPFSSILQFLTQNLYFVFNTPHCLTRLQVLLWFRHCYIRLFFLNPFWQRRTYYSAVNMDLCHSSQKPSFSFVDSSAIRADDIATYLSCRCSSPIHPGELHRNRMAILCDSLLRAANTSVPSFSNSLFFVPDEPLSVHVRTMDRSLHCIQECRFWTMVLAIHPSPSRDQR